jgi:hypothetical protein
MYNNIRALNFVISDGLFSLHVEAKFQVLKLSSRFQISEFQNPGINDLSRDVDHAHSRFQEQHLFFPGSSFLEQQEY